MNAFLKILFALLLAGSVSLSRAAAPDTPGHEALTLTTVPKPVLIMAPEPAAGLTLGSVGRGLLGVVSLLGIAFALSRDRRAVDWKGVALGLGLQLVLALGVLYVPFVAAFFEFFGKVFLKILDFSRAGAAFLFGDLVDLDKTGYIFVFQILPTIVFFSAFASLLYYLNIIQRAVAAIAWGLRKLFRLSGAEGLAVAGNIFLGQTEAPLLVKKYLPSMDRSELFLVMSAGMATIAGGVLAAYIGMLGGSDPAARLQFAKYLISASVMAAPAVIVISKILIPRTGPVNSAVRIPKQSVGTNLLDVLTNGAAEGMKLAVNVAAMLLVFIAMIALVNYLLDGVVGRYTGLNEGVARWTDGRYTGFDLQFLLGIVFTPVAWLMGVGGQDMTAVGSLLGTKLILNEFVAYSDLAAMKDAGVFYQQKSVIMATYLLCGFANFGSIGIQIGGLGSLAPGQRSLLTRYGFLAMICGTLASCLSATVMGMILG